MRAGGQAGQTAETTSVDTGKKELVNNREKKGGQHAWRAVARRGLEDTTGGHCHLCLV